VTSARSNIDKEIQTIHRLSETASKQPYYKFNFSWTRQIQDAVRTVPRDTAIRFANCYSASPSYYVDGWEDSERSTSGSCSRSRTWAASWAVRINSNPVTCSFHH